MSKIGMVIALVSLVCLTISGFMLNLPLCLGFGVMMGAGFAMFAIGD